MKGTEGHEFGTAAAEEFADGTVSHAWHSERPAVVPARVVRDTALSDAAVGLYARISWLPRECSDVTARYVASAFGEDAADVSAEMEELAEAGLLDGWKSSAGVRR